ncbi:Nramp family divalent metal transporter [Muricauda sp. ANG21]|uniref:Nramp family divalent metal transporter n=1 Tax=Allomuricauda sp. ANG21 TaxID=3042468 RepID=UPI003451A808
MKLKLIQILKSVGPAFIMASVVIGPGSITVASSVGSESGYELLWVIAISTLLMVVYTSMGVRFGLTNETSFLQTVANNYSKKFAVFIGLAVFFAAASWQFGNNLGIGIAMHEITNVQAYVWPMVFTPMGIVLIFYAKNLYKILEKLMMIMVLIMILSFSVNIILIKPDLFEVSKGFIPSKSDLTDLNVITALVGTTFALPAAMYQAYLVKDKGWGTNNLREGVISTNMGVVTLSLITMMIVITSGATLYPNIRVNSAAGMALQLELLFGSYAKYIFSIGLCAAAFSSLMINAVIGGGLLADSLGMGRSMNTKMPRLFTAIILTIGMIISVFFKGNVIYAMIMAQASSILGVPFIAIGLILVLNNKKIMKNETNNWKENLFAIVGFFLICIMVYFMYHKLIQHISTL